MSETNLQTPERSEVISGPSSNKSIGFDIVALSPDNHGAEVKGQWWKETHIQDRLIRPPVAKHPWRIKSEIAAAPPFHLLRKQGCGGAHPLAAARTCCPPPSHGDDSKCPEG